MKIIKIIKKAKKISFLKTAYFNFHYFGIKGLFVFPVLIGKNVELRTLCGNIIIKNFKTAVIQIGIKEMANIPKQIPSVIHNRGTLIFEDSAILGIGTCIANNGTITFGKNFCITAKTSIICKESVTFGDDVLISWNCQIMDSDLHSVYDIKTNELLNPNKSIKIGNHNWICSGVTINKGVIVEDNNIIASNSTINKPIPSQYCIIGNFGQIIKENVIWSS